ncbi:MAG: hypothetical protein JWP95_1469 [Actinotalea sp.]|nr:hypothetical protein [Actinotalea sp.]
MSHTPYEPTDESDARATELRELAGPVNGDSTGNHDGAGGDHGDTTGDDSSGAPAHSPDALTDPEVDEVRADQGDDVVPDEVSDPYSLRSMPTEPHPSADDPGGSLNY